MGVVIAMWLARLEAAVLGRVFAASAWLLSVLGPGSSASAGLRSDEELDDSDNRRHPSHTAPGLWWFAPRAAVVGWLIGTTAAAAHRARGHTPSSPTEKSRRGTLHDGSRPG